ncbi:putative alkaline shock family protein YloU [Friedmanniella endophytica]|uniref:Putative alkaline shock family protein YloU n=1 Tax=Microlunatus kandeliicorticis TaxID=1759536 RepID=A0A7W3P7G1_9ACTN|nr:Asp23/Gls24 family envelope stress response protein [Microlunatus kandeliicorticis]MBA8795927.1 putative alkaline shock family protein YloU [Microlunatus kandeliicorticis]
MSQSVVPATGEERRQAEAKAAKEQAKAQEQQQPKELDALHTEHGDTSIADTVVAKIAGIAAREVPGVFAMGNAARRAINQLAQRIPGGQTNVSGGVSVEKGERQTAIEIAIVVDYGVSIVNVADQIRENVINAVEYGTGLEVVGVNVNVTDVHLPEDDDDADTGSSSSEGLR